MAYEEHQQSARNISAGCAVITLSDTRNESTDTSGAMIKDLLIKDGHSIVLYACMPDDPNKLKGLVEGLLNLPEIDAILANGGTGISRRDQTIGVIERSFEQ